MANLYDGQPDGRQSPDVIATTRFRPRYRALTDEEKNLHDRIKAHADAMDLLYAEVRAGRYHSLAITALEESVMWIVKELTS